MSAPELMTAEEIAAITVGKEAAQALAGHKSPEMTAHYYEHTQEVWVQPVRVK